MSQRDIAPSVRDRFPSAPHRLMSAPTPPAVRGIDHVSLVVADLEATHRFYADFLGMEAVARPDFDFDGAWFRAGTTLVHAIALHDRSGPVGINERDSREGTAPCPKSSRWKHLAFAVDDVSPFVGRADDAGVPILSGPKRRPDGVRQLFVTDPDGHIIELTE